MWLAITSSSKPLPWEGLSIGVSGRLAFTRLTLGPSHQAPYLVEGEIGTGDADGTDQRTIWRYRRIYIAGMTWSPDASLIAFATRGPRMSHLYVIDAEGSRPPSEVTTCSGSDCLYSPAWSPDGQRFAFGRNGDIYVMGTHGRSQHRLTNCRTSCVFVTPTWSPDGGRIAFAEYAPRPGIFVMDADGGTIRRLASFPCDPSLGHCEQQPDSWPTWSPDGMEIAFMKEGRVRVMRADGGAAAIVARCEDLGLKDSRGNHCFPVLYGWSPDGGWIAVAGRGLWLVPRDGSSPLRVDVVRRWPGGVLSPDWHVEAVSPSA